MTGLESSYFEDLQGRLRGLLIAVSDRLPPVTVGLVNELIDANECGIALETLSEMLVESNVVLTAETLQDVGRLAETMGLAPVNVDRLRALVGELPSSEDE